MANKTHQTSEGPNVKTTILLVVMGLLFTTCIYLLSRVGCNNYNHYPDEEISHSIVIDTVYLRKVDTFYREKIVYRTKLEEKVSSDVLEKLRVIMDDFGPAKPVLVHPLWKEDGSTEYLVDTMAILQDYLSAYQNIDTVQVDAGNIIITDTIAANVITGRSVVTDINQPYIIRREKIPVERAILYAGVVGQTNIQGFGVAGGISLDLKTKRKAIYQLSGLLGTKGIIVQAGYKLPIRLRN